MEKEDGGVSVLDDDFYLAPRLFFPEEADQILEQAVGGFQPARPRTDQRDLSEEVGFKLNCVHRAVDLRQRILNGSKTGLTESSGRSLC